MAVMGEIALRGRRTHAIRIWRGEWAAEVGGVVGKKDSAFLSIGTPLSSLPPFNCEEQEKGEEEGGVLYKK